jgi:hypothetical protein
MNFKYPTVNNLLLNWTSKRKPIAVRAWAGPKGSRRLGLPDFMNMVRLSALRTGCLYPKEIFLVLIVLEAESTPAIQCSRKNYVNEKFQ